MSIGRTLQRWLLKLSEPIVINECRNCGTTLSDDVSHCPTCNSNDICHYEIQ